MMNLEIKTLTILLILLGSISGLISVGITFKMESERNNSALECAHKPIGTLSPYTANDIYHIDGLYYLDRVEVYSESGDVGFTTTSPEHLNDWIGETTANESFMLTDNVAVDLLSEYFWVDVCGDKVIFNFINPYTNTEMSRIANDWWKSDVDCTTYVFETPK